MTNFGSFPLAYHSLQPDLSLFQLDGFGYIAYRQLGGKSYVLADPICHPENRTILLDRFLAAHPQSVFAQVCRATALQLRDRGFQISRFGIETSLPLPYSLTGGRKADVRHLNNRAIAAGVTVRELLGPERQSSTVQDLLHGPTGSRRRFEKPFRFLARSGLPLDDAAVRVFGACAGTTLVGLSVFDPLFRNGQVFGYAEVIPRRVQDAPKGTRTRVLVEAMRRFADEGCNQVSLGLSPLAAEYDTPDELVSAATTEWLLEQLYRCGSRVFNFRGLAFHKSRFRGDERTVYLATPGRMPIGDLWRIYYLVTGKVLPPLPR